MLVHEIIMTRFTIQYRNLANSL